MSYFCASASFWNLVYRSSSSFLNILYVLPKHLCELTFLILHYTLSHSIQNAYPLSPYISFLIRINL